MIGGNFIYPTCLNCNKNSNVASADGAVVVGQIRKFRCSVCSLTFTGTATTYVPAAERWQAPLPLAGSLNRHYGPAPRTLPPARSETDAGTLVVEDHGKEKLPTPSFGKATFVQR